MANVVDEINEELRKLQKKQGLGQPISTSRASAFTSDTVAYPRDESSSSVKLPQGLQNAIDRRMKGLDNEDAFLRRFWDILTGKRFKS
jgi:hypothetical protein